MGMVVLLTYLENFDIVDAVDTGSHIIKPELLKKLRSNERILSCGNTLHENDFDRDNALHLVQARESFALLCAYTLVERFLSVYYVASTRRIPGSEKNLLSNLKSEISVYTWSTVVHISLAILLDFQDKKVLYNSNDDGTITTPAIGELFFTHFLRCI